MIYSLYSRGFIMTIPIRFLLYISFNAPIICPTNFLPFFSFDETRVWTQDFELITGILRLSYAPFCFGCFFTDRVLWTIYPGWPQIMVLLPLPSKTRITGMSHWCLGFYLLCFVFFFFFFERQSLVIYPRLALNSWSSCPSSITDMLHLAQLQSFVVFFWWGY
jgi:hypothetical protein